MNHTSGYQAEMAVQEARKAVVDAKISGTEAMDVDGTDGFVVAADVPGAQAQRVEVMAKIEELQVNTPRPEPNPKLNRTPTRTQDQKFKIKNPNPKPQIPNPKPETPNLKPQTSNPQTPISTPTAGEH